jgi:hypothetical protein
MWSLVTCYHSFSLLYYLVVIHSRSRSVSLSFSCILLSFFLTTVVFKV